jgi:hypothetical protein
MRAKKSIYMRAKKSIYKIVISLYGLTVWSHCMVSLYGLTVCTICDPWRYPSTLKCTAPNIKATRGGNRTVFCI